MRPFLFRHWPLTLITGLCVLLSLWGMLAPLGGGSHQLLLEFPKPGMRGGLGVPGEIRLTRGVRDVLLIRNHGNLPVVFGPLKIGAGRELRLPFGEEGVFTYACPAVVGALVRVRVVAAPPPGWGRLRWRLGNLQQSLRYLPLQSPDDRALSG